MTGIEVSNGEGDLGTGARQNTGGLGADARACSRDDRSGTAQIDAINDVVGGGVPGEGGGDQTVRGHGQTLLRALWRWGATALDVLPTYR